MDGWQDVLAYLNRLEPLGPLDGDARYVFKTGDTLSGALHLPALHTGGAEVDGVLQVGSPWTGLPADIAGYCATLETDVFFGTVGPGVGRTRLAGNANQGFISWNEYYDGAQSRSLDHARPSFMLDLYGAGDQVVFRRAPATGGPLAWSILAAIDAGGISTPGRLSSTRPGGMPVEVASTTRCDNLNADLLDGQHAAAFSGANHDMVSGHTYTGGAALDVFGLSAPGVLARLTPSSSPGAAAALLATNGSGGLALDTSTLVVDAANHRVGIGTASPAFTGHFVRDTNGVVVAYDLYSGDPAAALTALPAAYRAARGTPAAPAAVRSGDLLAGITSRGHNGSAFVSSSRGYLGLYAGEDWTPANNGAYWVFATTRSGEAAATPWLWLLGSGCLGLNTSNPAYRLVARENADGAEATALLLHNGCSTEGTATSLQFGCTTGPTALTNGSGKLTAARQANGALDLSIVLAPGAGGALAEAARWKGATRNLLLGTTTDGLTGGGSLAVAQDLAHRGSRAGFFNAAPAVRSAVAGLPAWTALPAGTDHVDLAELNARLQAVRDKLQALLAALQSYGLV